MTEFRIIGDDIFYGSARVAAIVPGVTVREREAVENSFERQYEYDEIWSNMEIDNTELEGRINQFQAVAAEMREMSEKSDNKSSKLIKKYIEKLEAI